jgi:hypothetical protein
MQIDANPMVSATSYFRDSLSRTDIYPEHGYSCEIMQDGVTERLSLANGAKISNSISSMGYTVGSFWSPAFVHRFVAQNSPSTPIVYFRCEGVRDLLKNGNEAALLTTAINAHDLELPETS